MIEIRNLSKSFGKKVVLDNLNLIIQEKQVHGLVGSNGVGKTTLFNCMYNILKYEGNILYISEIKNIGYMPAASFFYSNMKGIEYIEFCLVARKQKIDRTLIEEINKLFELPLVENAKEYSTGMKKKLVLMSLFLQKNDLFLLDEPFNGLDLASSLLLKHLILKMKESGKTIFLSSHIISSLTDICDTISYLHKGNISKTYGKAEYDLIESDIIQSGIDKKLAILENLDLY